MKKKTSFVILTLICLLLTKKYIVDIAVVDGNSMYPTLNNNDVLVVLKNFYEPTPNDIVLIKLNNEVCIVKRVIALGGSEVQVDYEHNSVYVNDVQVKEPYLNYESIDPMQQDGTQSNYVYIVPQGYVFVMGDNRNFSIDSRDSCIGVINTSNIIGKIIYSVNVSKW